MKNDTNEHDEEFLPAWAQGPFASWKAFQSGLARYLTDARASSNPREQLFASLTPWIRPQIKRYQNIWDGSIQFKAEDLSQTFRQLLWESVVEWDCEKSRSKAFGANPTGVIIRKTQAKIRRWYQEERKRYWVERALIHDIDDEWMTITEYVGGWKKEAKQAATAKDRRYAEKVVRILSTIGDMAAREQRGPTQADLIRDLRKRNRAAELAQIKLALRCGAVDEDDFTLLTSGPIGAPDRTTYARFGQRRSRARRRFLAWRNSPDGFAVLVREGLQASPDDLCWLVAAASKPSRRIPQQEIDGLREALFALPGGQESWGQFVATGKLEDAWMDWEYGPDGYFTWDDLGFSEAETEDN